MQTDRIRVHGPWPPATPAGSVVLDAPHSGRTRPEDFGAAIGERCTPRGGRA